MIKYHLYVIFINNTTLIIVILQINSPLFNNVNGTLAKLTDDKSRIKRLPNVNAPNDNFLPIENYKTGT